MRLLQEQENIQEFLDKFTYGEVRRWQIQQKKPDDKDVSYKPPFCEICNKHSLCQHVPALSVNDLRNHFRQKPIKSKRLASVEFGSYCVPPVFENMRCRFLCIDCDSTSTVKLIKEKFVPVLKQYDIEYIWEHSHKVDESAKSYEARHITKGKLWYFVDCQLDDLEHLQALLLEKAGLENWQELKRETKNDADPFKVEFYPTQKRNNMIRLPGGYHIRNEQANPITYKKKTGSDPDFILISVKHCEQVSEDQVKYLVKRLRKDLGKKDPRLLEEHQRNLSRGSHSRDKFLYTPLNLPLPKAIQPLPPTIEPMFRNCQALQFVAKEVATGALEATGDDVHFVGLQLDNLAVLHERLRDDGVGDDWIQKIYDLRHRSWDDHNWQAYKDGVPTSKLVPTCKTWENNLGLCNGCKFKDRPNFKNPRQFVWGEPVKREVLKEIKPITLETVRTQEFRVLRGKILQEIAGTDLDKYSARRIIGLAKPTDSLMAHPTGAGKSTSLVSRPAGMLAKSNYYSIIAVPNHNLAQQYKKDITEAYGIVPFVLSGFENIWKDPDVDIVCPNYDDILRLDDLGMPSQIAKQRFCKNCPLREECPYPTQYKEVLEPEHKIVIIQHAHFRAKQAMDVILQKGFHALFVDEDFTANTFLQIKPTPEEITFMEWLVGDITWMKPLLTWFQRGGSPKGEIDFTQWEMQWLVEKFAAAELTWNLPGYLRAFNEGYYFDKFTGLDLFVPLPEEIPHRILTDATPPVEMLKIILNNPNLRVFGAEHLVDPKAYHPDNEYIQVLNGSTSRSSRLIEGYLDALLRFVGQKVVTDYEDLSILVTVFADEKEYAERFFEANFPAIGDRLQVSHMEKGTNAYENTNVQFILCSPYTNAKQLATEAYKIRTIRNYWADLYPEEVESEENPYPLGITEDSDYEKEEELIARFETVEKNGERVIEQVQYEQFKFKRPTDTTYELVRKLMATKKLQADRLRLKEGQVRVVWDFDKINTRKVITKSIMIEDLLSIYRELDHTTETK